MKKLLILFMILMLLLLSGCSKYTDEDFDKLDEEWLEKYSELENKYYNSLSLYDNLYSAIEDIDNEFASVYLYYACNEDCVTESEALNAIENINSKLNEYCY